MSDQTAWQQRKIGQSGPWCQTAYRLSGNLYEELFGKPGVWLTGLHASILLLACVNQINTPQLLHLAQRNIEVLHVSHWRRFKYCICR